MSNRQDPTLEGPIAVGGRPGAATPPDARGTPRQRRAGRTRGEPLGRRGGPGADTGSARDALPVRSVAIWAALITTAFGLGTALRSAGALPVDAFPPLHASPRFQVLPLLPAAAVASAGVMVLPALARRLRWPALLVVSWAASAVWAVSLQWPDGVSRPLTAPTEYLAGLPAMGSHPLAWLRGFTAHLQEYPTHVKGHPPLPMLILWTLRWTDLGGAGWAATMVIVVGASSTAAIAITVRALTDEPTARRAVPFVVLAPTAIWLATSMDAAFLGLSAWAVALLSQASAGAGEGGPRPPWGAIPLPSSRVVDKGDKGFHRLWKTSWRVVSATGGRMAGGGSAGGGRSPGGGSAAGALAGGGLASGGRRSDRLIAGLRALAAGTLTGSLPYLSYGLLTTLALPLAVLLLTRPPRERLVAFGAGCAVVPLAFTLAGFRWWDGVVQTHAAWAAGAGSDRPYAYFLVGDLAVLALVIGPAAACALPRVREIPGLGVVVGAAFIGALALDLSGVTRGEVERIWLPYAAWMTAGVAVHRVRRRVLLAQVATALLLQAVVRSPW